MRCYHLYIGILIIVFSSCNTFKDAQEREIVARVNSSFLYMDEIMNKFPENTTKEDSITIVNNYIKRWATKQLLLDRAKLNLAQEEMNDFNALVKDYKNTLYTNAYKNAVIAKSIDEEVSEAELENYYEKNQKNFKLKTELIQLRYVQLSPDYENVVATRKQFDRYNDEDRIILNENKLQFIKHSFEDSLWVELDQVIEKIPVLKKLKKKEILKKQKTIHLLDSLGVYLVRIKKVLKRNETAPLGYVKSTVKQIILNKRKQELVRKLEKDITKDAIKNKQFEIYN